MSSKAFCALSTTTSNTPSRGSLSCVTVMSNWILEKFTKRMPRPSLSTCSPSRSSLNLEVCGRGFARAAEK